MPSYTRGQLRDILTFVKVNANLWYGFVTKDFASITGLGITAADITALGHTTPAAVPVAGLRCIGSQSPKPPVMSKVINRNPGVSEQGKVSTFAAYNAIETAEAKGWRIVRPGRGVTFSNNARTIAVAAVTSSGLNYVWPVNAADANNFAEALGLKLPGSMSDTERSKSITGTRYPRPAKLKKKLQGGGTRTLFCSANKVDEALAAGWELVQAEIHYGAAAPTETT